MPKTSLTETERYWSKIDRRGDDEYWPWTASTNRSGYGTFGVNGGSVLAHRYGYKLAFGPFDPHLCVLHRCDNPPCQNPAHFFLGTRIDNNADRHRKGRSARGERMGSAVLTEDMVRAINRRYREGISVPRIAAEFRVAKGTIDAVRRQASWVHLGLDWSARPGRLDAEKVREIRRRFSEGESRAEIAPYYHIKPKYINEIVSRRAWASVA